MNKLEQRRPEGVTVFKWPLTLQTFGIRFLVLHTFLAFLFCCVFPSASRRFSLSVFTECCYIAR